MMGSMDQIVVSYVLLGLLGVVAGLLSGLLGIGGGIILVPALLYYGQVFYAGHIAGDSLTHMAVGTSLAVIVPTTMSSALAQFRRQGIEWPLVKRLAPGMVGGVLIGIVIAAGTGGSTLQTFFALGLVGVAALTVRQPAPRHLYPQLLRWPLALPATCGIGVISTMMGISGAVLGIPYMTQGGVPLRKAIGTGAVLGLFVALPASLGYVLSGQQVGGLPPEFLGYVNLKAWAMIVPCSIFVAPQGVKLSHRIDVVRLRKIFAGIILLIAARILWHVFATDS